MSISERGGLNVAERLGVERFGTILGCVNALHTSYAMKPLSESILGLLGRFYLNSIYKYCYAYFLKSVFPKIEILLEQNFEHAVG